MASILKEAEGLAGVRDPLQAELLASGVLSMWRSDDPMQERRLEAVGAEVLGRLGDHTDPDVMAMLQAFSATAEPPLDAAARDAVEHLRSARVPEPIWSSLIGRPTLVDAWASTDELDDQTQLLAAFAYEGLPAHAFSFIVDANFQGLIRDAFVANDPAKVRREWIAVSGLPIRALGPQDLADLLGQGVRMYDLYLEPPVTDEVDRLVPLVRSRLKLLPPPRDIPEPETTEEERERLVDAFLASPEAAGLGSDRDHTAVICHHLVDFACDYGAGDPLRWSPIAVEICLVDWFPRKVILEGGNATAVPDVLRRWIRYSGRHKGLSDDLVAETLQAVDTFANVFAEGMADEQSAGPAKQIAAKMLADGIDLTDEGAVARWIDTHNSGLRGR